MIAVSARWYIGSSKPLSLRLRFSRMSGGLPAPFCTTTAKGPPTLTAATPLSPTPVLPSPLARFLSAVDDINVTGPPMLLLPCDPAARPPAGPDLAALALAGVGGGGGRAPAAGGGGGNAGGGSAFTAVCADALELCQSARSSSSSRPCVAAGAGHHAAQESALNATEWRQCLLISRRIWQRMSGSRSHDQMSLWTYPTITQQTV